MNEEAVQWVENEDWMYRTSFVVNEQQLRIQVKPVLRKGVNHLLVRFRSAVKEVLPQLLTNGFEYPASNDHSPWRTSVYTRKAPYSYGWDWGIRLATCGIWRPVRLVFSDVARIEDYYVCQKSVSANRAKVDNRLEINNVTSRTVTALLKVDYHYSANDTKEISKRIELHPGENTVNLPARFEDLVYMGLVLQGHGMRHGMEAHRRNRPYCNGKPILATERQLARGVVVGNRLLRQLESPYVSVEEGLCPYPYQHHKGGQRPVRLSDFGRTAQP